MFPLIPVAASALLPSTSALTAGGSMVALYFLFPPSADAAMPIRREITVSGKASSASSDLAIIKEGASNVDLLASRDSVKTRGKGDGSPCNPISGEIGCPPPPPPPSPPYQPPVQSPTQVATSLPAQLALTPAQTAVVTFAQNATKISNAPFSNNQKNTSALVLPGNTSVTTAQNSSDATQILIAPFQTNTSELALPGNTSGREFFVPTSGLTAAQNSSNATKISNAPFQTNTSELVLARNTSGREFFMPTSGFTAAQNFSNSTIFLRTSALWSPDGNAIQISNASFPNNQTNTTALSTTGNPMVSNSNITFIQYTNVSDIAQILKNESLVLLGQNSSSQSKNESQILSYSGIEPNSDDSKKYIIIGSVVGTIMLGGAAVLAWKYCRQRAPANPQQPQQEPAAAIFVVNHHFPGHNPNNANAHQLLAAINGQGVT